MHVVFTAAKKNSKKSKFVFKDDVVLLKNSEEELDEEKS